MKLIDVVMNEMIEQCGEPYWPNEDYGVVYGCQDEDNRFFFYRPRGHNDQPEFDGYGDWSASGFDLLWEFDITGDTLPHRAEDYTTKVLTKEDFDAWLKAKNEPEVAQEESVALSTVEQKRDRILIIDNQVKGLIDERTKLIIEIEAAGFKMIGISDEKESLSEDRLFDDWKLGDTVQLVKECDTSSMTLLSIGVITEISSNGESGIEFEVNDRYWPDPNCLVRIKKKGE